MSKEDYGDTRDDRTPRRWLGWAAVMVAFAVTMQRFGEIVYLTRLDRVMDPLRLASRSFTLWNPYWDMGSIQYQTVGYWIPFDATFALGTVLHIPTWITERIFIAGLVIIAFWGLTRLADAMKIGTKPFRLLAGLGYALSTVILSRIGQQSVFAMGAVFLPWALIPLVHGSKHGSTRKAAALSGVAIALMGGANAAVTLAVLPVPALYLLTRARGPRRASLIRWWALAVPLSILWWLVSLYFFARYGPDILKYTETVQTTTSATPIFDVIRGSADWFARMAVEGVALPSGNTLSLRTVPIIGSTLLAGLGLAGLASKRMPEKKFLIITLLAGVALVGGGYGGLFGSPLAGEYRTLLGGTLGAFRNVYKFQALLTLPLALGSAHALTRVAGFQFFTGSRARRVLIPVAMVLIVAGACFPLWNNVLTKGKGFTEVPQAWSDAKDYLDANNDGRVLIVPGLPEANYEWGFLQQTPLQWGTDASWATRNQAPLGGPGNIQYLDAVELAITNGGDTSLPDFLQRGGFSAVLVPNDSRYSMYSASPPETMKTGLEASGLRKVAGFGPQTYGFGDLNQIDLYAVSGTSMVQAYSAADATWLSGDIESVLRLRESIFGKRAYILAADRALSDQTLDNWVVTDGNQRYLTEFGRNRNNRSFILGPNENSVNGQLLSAHEYTTESADDQTFQVLTGVSKISASSVGPGIISKARADSQPSNIFDGDPTTIWRPLRVELDTYQAWGNNDQWVEIQFDTPRIVEPMQIELAVGGYRSLDPIPVRVTTDAGTKVTVLDSLETVQSLNASAGMTSRLRITFPIGSYRQGGDVIGIRELQLPGDPIVRRLQVPAQLNSEFSTPTANTPAWVFNRERNIGSSTIVPIKRLFDAPKATTVGIYASGSVTPSDELIRVLGTTPIISVFSNSTYGNAAALSPRNLIDNDPSTFWVSGLFQPVTDTAPSIGLEWNGERTISGFQLQTDPQYDSPTSVTISSADQARDVPVLPDGVVEFDPITGSTIQISLHFADFVSGNPVKPVGLHGIDIPALRDLYLAPLDPRTPLAISCSDGPSFVHNGNRTTFSADTTLGDFYGSKTISLVPCESQSVLLTAGSNTLDSTGGILALNIDQLVLGNPPVTSPSVEVPRTTTPGHWGETTRTLTAGPGAKNFLVVNEVFNEGWEARLGGVKLEALQIDGWRQAFVLPAGDGGEVTLTFLPNRSYQIGTGIALGLLVLLIGLALWPDRKRRSLAAVGEGQWPRPLLVGLLFFASVWCTGIGVIMLPVLVVFRKRFQHALPLVAFGSFAIAGIIVVFTKGNNGGTGLWHAVSANPVSLLSAVALLTLVASTLSSDK
jgi:arabinofuranan 3-O-arabinosyltransferase